MEFTSLCEELQGRIGILCETLEERRRATQLLLELGCRHGGSGYSRAVLDPTQSVYTDTTYLYPFIYGDITDGAATIEYSMTPRKDAMSLRELECILHPVDVDDLI